MNLVEIATISIATTVEDKCVSFIQNEIPTASTPDSSKTGFLILKFILLIPIILTANNDALGHSVLFIFVIRIISITNELYTKSAADFR